MTGLIEHMEGTLGPIECGWRVGEKGQPTSFQIVRYEPGSVGLDPRARAFSTLGLSRHLLGQGEDCRTLRLELLALAQRDVPDTAIVNFLADVGEEVARSHETLLRGDVIGPRGQLLPAVP